MKHTAEDVALALHGSPRAARDWDAMRGPGSEEAFEELARRRAREAWENDLSRCDHDLCMNEGTEPDGDRHVCPSHRRTAP